MIQTPEIRDDQAGSIKYISKKKAAAEAEVQLRRWAAIIWDVNPAMVENYYQRLTVIKKEEWARSHYKRST